MKTIVYMLIAGALGAMARFGISLFVTDRYDILLINIIGSFVLAFIFDYFVEMEIISATLGGAFGTGFLGAFTTFSAFSYANIKLFIEGDYISATVFSLCCLIGGLVAAYLGIKIASILCKRKEMTNDN